MAAVSAAAALALNSCDPPILDVKDNSALEKVTLEASNDTPKWEFGEERTITISPYPATAVCERFELRTSNAEIVIIRSGELLNQFKVTANGEGKVILTGTALGHDGNGPLEKSDFLEFTLQDNRVKPVRPVVSIQMSPTTDIEAKKVIAEDSPAVIADSQDMLLTVSSDSERATYSLQSGDKKVLALERTGAQSWMLKTVAPGSACLNLTVTDGLGNSFGYAYYVYSFGHVTMTTEYDPLMAEAGISISEHNYPNLTGQVYMAGMIVGWPWNDDSNIATRDIPVFNGVLDFSEEFEYKALSETYDLQNEIHAITVGEGINKAWFTIHEARLNYIITLSNPYIIIDHLYDDNDREEPLFWNFWIDGALRQEGVAPVEMPQPIGFNPGVDGWNEGNEISIPL